MVISWTTYLTICLLVLVMYYTLIIFRFFRGSIVSSFKSTTAGQSESEVSRLLKATLPQEHLAHEITHLDAASAAPMHALVDELQACIGQAGLQGLTKECIIITIKQLIQKYPSFNQSFLQSAITNFIMVETQTHCNFSLNENDQMALWQ